MKQASKIIIGVVVIIVALGMILTFAFPQALFTPAIAPTEVAPRNDLANPDNNTLSPEELADLIVVSTPTKGATVSSPLIIKGKARGTWYFEASFPVELVDADTGLDIAAGTASAEGDWMTENFVPFTATLTFTKPPAPTQAMLILRKDNPSGLPENEASISIPVTVK